MVTAPISGHHALKANTSLIYVLGALLVIGRLMAAWGLSQSSGTTKGRQIGMALTLIALLVASLTVLAKITSGF